MRPVSVLAATLAVLAAALFAVAAALQQRAAATAPQNGAGALGLVSALVRQPLWWAGSVADVAGYVAQAAALGLGSLLLVQPLLVTSLLFALPLGARWSGRRLRPADRTWAVLLAAALALFVVTGEPTAGVDRAPPAAWWPVALALGVVLAGCLLGAAAGRGATRAVLLAVATGVLYGLAGALTKSVVSVLGGGVLALLGTWETYGLALALAAGTLLQQAAFRAGDLGASLPAVTVGEPVVAVGLGVAVLHEHLRAGGTEWLLVGVLVAVMVAATVALARSSAAVP
jgi:hypothetical protein